jgi:hypothetical protein
VSPAVRSLAALCIATLCALALSACADTLQNRPIPHNTLEGLIGAPVPVYWLGGSFQGMPISEATFDPSGAYSVQYGNCMEGGQGTCVTPVRIVTSPDNSFLPGGSAPSTRTRIRGVPAVIAQAGSVDVVVDIYATSAQAAAAAARTAVPINVPGEPEAPLAPALANTGFNERPLRSQVPPPLHPLG